jgi:hypothetical protein
MPRNMTKVEIIKFLSEKFGDSRIFIMPDNFRQFIKVEESFHSCPSILSTLEKS